MTTAKTVRAGAVVVAALIGVFVAMQRSSTRDDAPLPTRSALAAKPPRAETAERRRGGEAGIAAPAPVVEERAIDAKAVDAPTQVEAPRPIATPASLNDAVVLGLRWLKDRQSKDGSWRDPATTGVALLAFLGSGQTHQSGSYREAVKNGLKHLRDVQDGDGGLAPRGSARTLRDHAIAGLALCEAYGMTSSLVFKKPAQRAAAFAAKSRTPSSGWSRPDGRLEFEATVWMSMLLKSAKLCEFDVDVSALEDVVRAIDQVTDHATGRVTASDDGLSSEAATAMGMIVRVLAGRSPDDDEAIRKGAEVVAAKPPVLDPAHSPDYVDWYFGTRAIWSMGPDERWPPWAKALIAAFAGGQRTDDGDAERGSWDPSAASLSEADRVWSTAFAALSVSPITSKWYPGRLKKR